MRPVTLSPQARALLLCTALAPLLCLALCCGRGDADRAPIEPPDSVDPSISADEWGSISAFPSIEHGLGVASADRRPTMVYFHSDANSNCLRVVEELFTDPGVAMLAGHFVAVVVDVMEDKETPRAYGIDSFPSFVFLDHKGRVIRRVQGLKRAAELRLEMTEAENAFKNARAAESSDQE